MISAPVPATLRSLVSAAALCATCGAFAQDGAPAPSDNDDSLTIGVGGALLPSYDGSDDYRLRAGGGLRGKLSGHNFYTRGTSLFVDLIPEKPSNNLDLSFGPVVSARLQRTRLGGIKDAQVQALGKLKTAIEVGGFVGIAKTGVITSDYDNIGIRVSYLRDVNNAHDSYIITPAFEYGTPLSQTFYVGASVSADYVGSGYARTYFGVTPAGSAASGLATYDLDKGWKSINSNLIANLSLSGDLRTGWSVFALGGVSKILGDFKRSPIVKDAGRSKQWIGGIGVAYTF